MTYLYHYTDRKGLEAIVRSGYIKKSRRAGGDAAFGEGVYLTALDPAESTWNIIINNWDDSYRTLLNNPKVLLKAEFAICIHKLSIPEVQPIGNRDDRDIWLYPGNLHLAGKDVIVYQRPL